MKGDKKMLENQIRNFVTNLQSLRDFIEILNPLLHKEQLKMFEKTKAPSIIPYIMAMKAVSGESTFEDISDESLLKTFEGKVELNVKEVNGEKFLEGIKFSGKYAVGAHEFLNKLNQALKRIDLLYKSSLITLMSNVEWFFSEILHAYFSSYPSAIVAEDKSLSLEDLNKLGSIEEAQNYIIEKKVEKIMHGSFRDWIDSLKKKPKLTMSYLKPVIDKMYEVQRRRNLLIHNDGIVNRIYLSDLPEDLRKGLNVGDRISVELDYLNTSIELFELNCILVSVELWKKISASDTRRAKLLLSLAYDNLVKKRWKTTEGLCYFCMNDAKMSQEYTKLAKLNYWLSIKRQGRWEEVVEKANSEDFSAVKRRYRLGWLALCDKKDEFFELVSEVIKVGDITAKELKQFPIFKEVRKDPRFSKISVRKIKSKKSAEKKKSVKKRKAKKTKKKPRKKT
jgi:hypothetical protein